MSRKLHTLALRLCERVKGGDYPRTGICGEIGPYLPPDDGQRLREIFKSWPEFSGWDVYPVPGLGFAANRHGTSEQEAYDNATPRQMWSTEHSYGAARRRLLDFIISETDPEAGAVYKWVHDAG